jgi:hypothetical protein
MLRKWRRDLPLVLFMGWSPTNLTPTTGQMPASGLEPFVHGPDQGAVLLTALPVHKIVFKLWPKQEERGKEVRHFR